MGISMNGELIFPIALTLGTAVIAIMIVSKIGCLFGKKKKKLITLKDPNTKYALPLTDKEKISHDTRRFRFGLPSSEHVLGLPIGQHIHLSAKIDDDLVIRAYTPVSSDEEKGYVDLVVKVYFKNVHPKFPDGGKMSQHLESLKIGDTIDVRGPSGRLEYVGDGAFLIKKLRKDPPVKIVVNKVNLIAGGTGITPMLQLIRHICSERSDRTQLRLLFANQSEDDILLRDELHKYEREHAGQLAVWFTVDRAPDNWKYSVGFISEEMLRERMFPAADDTLTLMCGPPPMVNYACVPNLEKLGHKETMRFAY